MPLGNRILGAVGDLLEPVIEKVVKELFKTYLLQKLYDKDSQAYEVALTSFYGPTDVYLEGMVEKTDTKIDDAIVHGIMRACEESAVENSVELPNLDED